MAIRAEHKTAPDEKFLNRVRKANEALAALSREFPDSIELRDAVKAARKFEADLTSSGPLTTTERRNKGGIILCVENAIRTIAHLRKVGGLHALCPVPDDTPPIDYLGALATLARAVVSRESKPESSNDI
jgi:hypothetical protein